MDSLNIAIVGAGLVGRLLAWRLNEHYKDQNKTYAIAINITLIDEKDRDFFGTGLIAAAMVAPFTEAVTTDPITQKLGSQSYHLWEKWLPELEQHTEQKISFNQKGTLVVSHAQDKPDWNRFLIKAKIMLNDQHMQKIDQHELQQLEPELKGNFSKALYFPEEGVVDNFALYKALNQYFTQSENIQFIENTQITAMTNDGKIAELNHYFDHVFDCRGNGAKADLTQFRSVRGEVVRVYAPEVNFQRAIRLIHPRFPLYIAPRPNHEYIIGATQIESEVDTPVTVRSGLELLSALYSLHPGFGEAQILQMSVGLRPSFIDNLPQIATDHQLTRINGLYRHGYLFAPTLINDLLKSPELKRILE